ncbi:MAG: acetylglutamate kinase [Chloroflexi bacterium]|nr:acetylglutamate kinase [Chloroflexota bacterium]
MVEQQETLAAALYEALPYIRGFAGKTIVVKLGGSAFGGRDTTLQDIVTLRSLGVKPVLVHGGGSDISSLLKRLGAEPRFVGGLRVTDEATLEAVVMVLAGKVNKELVGALGALGAPALGLSGIDGGLLQGRVKDPALGLVGEVTQVNLAVLEMTLAGGFVPVVAPLAVGESGRALNVNGDTAAGEIAAALHAAKMIFLTDVPGILNADGTLISQVSRQGIQELIQTGVVSGGMIPKVMACVRSLEGAERAHVVDGRAPHALIQELYTDRGVGTMITA